MISHDDAWKIVRQYHKSKPHSVSMQLWIHMWLVFDGVTDDVPRFDILTTQDWDSIINFCGGQEMKSLLENLRVMYC